MSHLKRWTGVSVGWVLSSEIMKSGTDIVRQSTPVENSPAPDRWWFTKSAGRVQHGNQALKGPQLAGIPPSRHVVHRSLWVPGGRAEPFFPLCPRRSSWIRCPPVGAELPPARVAESAPSGIIRTRSRRYAWCWRAFCCGNCITALFVVRLRAERGRRNRFHRCRFAAGSVARCATHLRATRPS
jgi:hypothetical protein